MQQTIRITNRPTLPTKLPITPLTSFTWALTSILSREFKEGTSINFFINTTFLSRATTIPCPSVAGVTASSSTSHTLSTWTFSGTLHNRFIEMFHNDWMDPRDTRILIYRLDNNRKALTPHHLPVVISLQAGQLTHLDLLHASSQHLNLNSTHTQKQSIPHTLSAIGCRLHQASTARALFITSCPS